MNKIKAAWLWCTQKAKELQYRVKAYFKYRKKMKEIKKRDPFVYK